MNSEREKPSGIGFGDPVRWRRMVIIGDTSATRSAQGGQWTDRVAEAIRDARPDLACRVLTRRGSTLSQIRSRVLDKVLDFGPDLVLLVFAPAESAGMETELSRVLAPLRAAGADVVVAQAGPGAPAGTEPAVQAVCLRHGAVHVVLGSGARTAAGRLDDGGAVEKVLFGLDTLAAAGGQ